MSDDKVVAPGLNALQIIYRAWPEAVGWRRKPWSS